MDSTVQFLRDEVLRQIDLTWDLYRQIQDTTSGRETNAHLLRDTQEDVARHLDTRKVARRMRVMRDERLKVEQLEYRFVVTGTMKAGKTTAICAITGMDFLPTRVEAMTTLPTLIKHTPGAAEPRLSLRSGPALNGFLETIRQRWELAPLENLEPGVGLTYTEVRDGASLPTDTITGVEPIRRALRHLNDLLRLAELTGVEHADTLMGFFESSEDLPVVEVEFSPISGLTSADSLGRLVLVDSPGPNEARFAERLTAIVGDQLDRCSALVVVKNYTIQGAKDDEEMNRIAEEYLSHKPPEANILLVNRYDAAHDGDPDPTTQKAALAAKHPRFQSDNIFLVSAIKAKLASFVKLDLLRFGEIHDRSFLGDFAKYAFGDDYDEEEEGTPLYADADKLGSAAEKVWRNSFFDSVPRRPRVGRAPAPGEATPLSRMRDAATNAARNCLSSALTNLRSENSLISTFLSIRGRLNDDEIAMLEDQIQKLDNDLQQIARARRSVETRLERAKSDFLLAIQTMNKDWSAHVDVQITAFFQTSKERSATQKTRSEPREYVFDLALFLRTIGHVFRARQTEPDPPSRTQSRPHDPRAEIPEINLGIPMQEGELLEFSSAQAAAKFQSDVTDSINAFAKSVAERIGAQVLALVSSLTGGVEEIVQEEMSETFENAKLRLGRAFGPTPKDPEALNFDSKQLLRRIQTQERSLAPYQRSETKVVRRDTAGDLAYIKRKLAAGANRFLGMLGSFQEKKWGTELREVQHQKFLLSKADLKARHMAALHEFQQDIEQTIRTLFSAAIEPEVADYFNQVVRYIEDYRNTIDDTLVDHRLSVEEREALRQKVERLRGLVEQLLLDVQVAMETLRGDRGIAS